MNEEFPHANFYNNLKLFQKLVNIQQAEIVWFIAR